MGQKISGAKIEQLIKKLLDILPPKIRSKIAQYILKLFSAMDNFVGWERCDQCSGVLYEIPMYQEVKGFSGEKVRTFFCHTCNIGFIMEGDEKYSINFSSVPDSVLDVLNVEKVPNKN